MKNTRTIDLERVDQARFTRKSEESQARMKATLVDIYEQSKDVVLEHLKMRLASVIGQLNTCADPTKFDGLYTEYWDIHDKVIAYTSTTTYRQNIARKIANQVGEKQAEEYFIKSERG